MSSVRSQTLLEATRPGGGVLAQTLLVLSAAGATALAAQIAIPLPFTPVPLTGQTFAVLVSGAMLGSRRGFAAQLTYLTAGALGLPVFAGGGGGLLRFFGPTGGYLLAFPLAAFVVGLLAERGWDRRFFTMLAAMALGTAVIHTLGLAWLSRFMPAASLLPTSLLPFLPGDVIKGLLAALALPAARRIPRAS